VYGDLDSGKIVFFPHGMDQMFWEPGGTIFPNFDSLVARALITIPEGRRRYREKLGALITNVYDVAKITNRMHEVQSRIRPFLGRNYGNIVADLRNRIMARPESVLRQLAIPDPKPLEFDANGETVVAGWSEKVETGLALLGKDGEALTIKVTRSGPTVASWRAKVLLEPGQYRLSARAQSTNLAAMNDEKGEGAGIRISGTQHPRTNKIVSTSPWKDLAYDFTAPGGEVVLICELRATRGEVAFALLTEAVAKMIEMARWLT